MGKKIASVLAILVIILVAAAIYFINPFQKQAQGGLQVVTYETDASLFLNDQYLDKSPYINRNINAKRYTLSIIPDNKELTAKDLTINLNPGTLTVVYWRPGPTLEKSSGLIYELESIANRRHGELQIITEPDEAIIHLGNRPQEFAPHVFRDLEPGDHTIQISLPGYENHEQKFNISAGYRLKITARLAQTGPSGDEAQLTEEDPDYADEQDQASMLTIQSTNFFQNGKEVLRVRDNSSVAGLPIGFVEVGESYPHQEVENGWYLISFEDALDSEIKEGWVSGQFIELQEAEDDDLSDLSDLSEDSEINELELEQEESQE